MQTPVIDYRKLRLNNVSTDEFKHLKLLYDVDTFRRMMKYIIITYSAAMLICISTVFMKQHSVIDLLAALPICAIAHLVCYKKER